LLVPDPATVHVSPGRPPSLVSQPLTGGLDALTNFVPEKVELVVGVDADELSVETATGARRVGVVEVLLSVRVHDKQVLSTAVRQPVIYTTAVRHLSDSNIQFLEQCVLNRNYQNARTCFLWKYRVGQKTKLFLRSYNFATTSDRKVCNTSKLSECCLE